MIDELYEQYMAFGNPHYLTEESRQQTMIFRKMVKVNKDDPNRPKNGDKLQNGARL